VQGAIVREGELLQPESMVIFPQDFGSNYQSGVSSGEAFQDEELPARQCVKNEVTSSTYTHDFKFSITLVKG
jgi:hypothetical protein